MFSEIFLLKVLIVILVCGSVGFFKGLYDFRKDK